MQRFKSLKKYQLTSTIEQQPERCSVSPAREAAKSIDKRKSLNDPRFIFNCKESSAIGQKDSFGRSRMHMNLKPFKTEIAEKDQLFKRRKKYLLRMQERNTIKISVEPETRDGKNSTNQFEIFAAKHGSLNDYRSTFNESRSKPKKRLTLATEQSGSNLKEIILRTPTEGQLTQEPIDDCLWSSNQDEEVLEEEDTSIELGPGVVNEIRPSRKTIAGARGGLVADAKNCELLDPEDFFAKRMERKKSRLGQRQHVFKSVLRSIDWQSLNSFLVQPQRQLQESDDLSEIESFEETHTDLDKVTSITTQITQSSAICGSARKIETGIAFLERLLSDSMLDKCLFTCEFVTGPTQCLCARTFPKKLRKAPSPWMRRIDTLLSSDLKSDSSDWRPSAWKRNDSLHSFLDRVFSKDSRLTLLIAIFAAVVKELRRDHFRLASLL